MEDSGDIRTWNPDKQISVEVTLNAIIRHRDAIKQARTGELPNIPMDNMTDNDRKFNQVRALNLIISAQREMITISRPIIYFRSIQQWKKDYKLDQERKDNPFINKEKDIDNIKYEYFKLTFWLDLLKYLGSVIRDADRTKRLDDDFIVKRQLPSGDKYELTENFESMLDELEDSYEQIYLLMLRNKVVSAGIEEDEEFTYKQQQEEAMKRIEEA